MTRIGSSPDYFVAVWRNVMILHVGGATDAAFLNYAMAGHNAALRYDPEGYGLVVLVEPTARIPGPAVREESGRLRVKTQHMLRAQAFVIGGEGFFASTMRAVITGIVTLAQSRVPTKNAANDAEAAAYVVSRACTPGTSADELLLVLRNLRIASR